MSVLVPRIRRTTPFAVGRNAALSGLVYVRGNFSWIILETRHILILILESRHIDSVMKVDIREAMAISLTVIVIRWDGHSIL